MAVIKKNKRLYIVDENGGDIYTPPDFVRLPSREPLKQLAERLIENDYITEIMEFEGKYRKK